MISFIVPVFNVENYIKECIDSLLSVKNIDFEIVVVDDGSTDKSIDIVKEYVETKLRIVHRENGGLAAARNTGLKNALGEYICFVDSDDFIDPESFQLFFSQVGDKKFEILVGEFYYFENNTKTPSQTLTEEILLDSGINILKKHFKKYSPVAWRSLYRKDFLIKYKLFFTEGIYFEDADWTPRVLYFASQIIYAPIHFYFYRQRTGSIMLSAYSHKKFLDRVYIANHLIDFSAQIKDEKIVNIYMFNSLYCLCEGIGKYASKNELSVKDKELMKHTLHKNISTDCKIRLLLLLFSLFPCYMRRFVVKKFNK